MAEKEVKGQHTAPSLTLFIEYMCLQRWQYIRNTIQNPWDVDSSKFKTLFSIFIFILKNNN